MNMALKHLSGLLAESVDVQSESMGEPDEAICELTEKLRNSFTKAIEIELEEIQASAEYRFGKVRLDVFDVENQCKYLYRSGDRSGPGDGITYKLGKAMKNDKIAKTPRQFAETALQKKVIGYLQKMTNGANAQAGRDFGRSVCSEIMKVRETILEQMTRYAEDLAPTKDDAIVTLVVSASGKRKYAQEIAPLKEFFIQCVNPETRELKGMSSMGENAVCSCCGRLSAKVFCQPQTLPYFTFDKPGFIAGGFFKGKEPQSKAWRNFPLCAECVLDVRRGFRNVETRLRFNLCGITYLLFPNFTDWASPDANTVVKTIAEFAKRTDPEMQRDQELLFARRLARETKTASFNYLFFRKKQSRMEILCTIENVLPSRMSEIADAIDRTEDHYLLARFGEWIHATKLGAIRIGFGLLRDLYQPRTETRGDPPVHHFLRAVQRLVYGQPFNEREFFDAAMRYIKDDLRKQQSEGREPWLALSVHRSLAVAFWLLNLGLLRFARTSEANLQRGESMTDYPELNAEDLNERFDEFFKTFGGLFAREEQRVCYLMGVLCAQVLSAQRKRFENRQPFFRHLKDLKLDEAEMRGLLPKLKSKLTEYDIDHFNWGLERAIAERFRRAGSPWKTTHSEINFFFALGLSEAPLFSAKSTDKTNQN